jgi:hypothetical protein
MYTINKTNKVTKSVVPVNNYFKLDNKNVYFNNPKPNNSSLYTAVIIEPREHKAFHFVLENYCDNLNEDWNFIVIHSIENENYIKNIIYNTELTNHAHRFTLICLEIRQMTVADYSMLFYNTSFYHLIPTEIFLIFQLDTIILNKNKINDFLKYDYVGAPWAYNVGNNGLGLLQVGNGGLSLRKKSKMLELLNYKDFALNKYNKSYGKYIAEDQFFSGILFNKFLFKPCFEEASQFSIESIYYEKPFGLHACWKFFCETDMNKLIELYPSIQILRTLNE